MTYILKETYKDGRNERVFDNLADAVKAYGNLISELIEGWGEENCEVHCLGKFHYHIATSSQLADVEIFKNETIGIDVQITGAIELTERELRRVIEQDDTKLMAEIIKRSFSAGGFATLMPSGAEQVNGILNTDYEPEDFEWTI